jgi:Nickel responsive protein SCO4226-like
MPRFLIVRSFSVPEGEMTRVGSRSRTLIETRFKDIVWEHSHVVVDSEGKVKTYCVYRAPGEEAVREHSIALGNHEVDTLYEIAGDVTPEDFPLETQP